MNQIQSPLTTNAPPLEYMHIQTRHSNLNLDDIEMIRDQIKNSLETSLSAKTTDDSFDRAFQNGLRYLNKFLTYCLDKHLTIKAACDTYNFCATEFGVREFLEGNKDDFVDEFLKRINESNLM